MTLRRTTIFIAAIIAFQQISFGQTKADTSAVFTDSTSLANCIKYAIEHQPQIRQSLINENITSYEIKNRLADWYPQVNFNYNYQHNFQLQTSIIGGNPTRFGVENTSAAMFSLNQNIFNRDVLLATRTRQEVMKQARQTTAATKIDVAVDVSKAFYEVLAAMQQIKIADGDIVRLERSLKDARSRYDAGITDKTDYKRATIALNNTIASRKASEEAFKARKQYLKFLMGYPEQEALYIAYDSLQMERDVVYDTLQLPDYKSRIEFNLLETQQNLLQSNLKYQRWSFLPTVSANGAWNALYLNDNIGKLYNNVYPQSYLGITLGFPIFQGGKRINNIRIAEFQLAQTNWQMVDLKNAVSSEYQQAIASYKSNLSAYLALKENLELAQDVYNVIQLQYQSGLKTYLEVITSETDLRNARINYTNALFQVLSSKVDVQKALGQINY